MHDYRPLLKTAASAIKRKLNIKDDHAGDTKGLEGVKAGIFVTLYLPGKKLRGCIGTISPAEENIIIETEKNSLSSAFKDPRFPPLSAEEYPDISIEISVIHEVEPLPENINRDNALNPDNYGVTIRTKDGRRAVLLPDIEGVDTWEQQIEICRRKGRIGPEESISIGRFKVDKVV